MSPFQDEAAAHGAAAEQISSNAEETSSQANVAAAAGEQVSGNVQTVASAIEELNATIEASAYGARP